MWKYLNKDCNCNTTPTNPGVVCNHNGPTTNDYSYQGQDVECSGIYQGMSVSHVLQHIDNYICGIELTQQVLNIIQNNIQEFNTFIELVNEMISCETINKCITTTTTTTICPCYDLNIIIQQEVIDTTDTNSAILSYTNCNGQTQEQEIITGGEVTLGCINIVNYDIILTGLIDGVETTLSFNTVNNGTCC